MAEPARNLDDNRDSAANDNQLDLRRNEPSRGRKLASDGADLIPFVGGVKMMGEAVAGKDMAGRELHGKDRLIHGALGAGSFALDFTGVGEVEKGAVAVGKVGAEIAGKEAAETAAKAAAVGAAKEGAEAGAKREADTIGEEVRRRHQKQWQEELKRQDEDRRTRQDAAQPYQGASQVGEKTPSTIRDREKAQRERNRALDKNARADQKERKEKMKREGHYVPEGGASGPDAERVRRAEAHLNGGSPEDARRAVGVLKETVRRTFEAIEEEWHKKGEKFNDADVEKVIHENPLPVKFPLFIFAIALWKDCIDLLDLTLVGIIVATIAAFFVDLIILFWSWRKMSGWWWKKMIIKWFWTRFIATAVIELIPFVEIVPMTTIFILMAHYREKKIVKLLNGALEMMNESGILKYIA